MLSAQCNLIWAPSLSPEPHSGGPANGTFNLRFFSRGGKVGLAVEKVAAPAKSQVLSVRAGIESAARMLD